MAVPKSRAAGLRGAGLCRTVEGGARRVLKFDASYVFDPPILGRHADETQRPDTAAAPPHAPKTRNSAAPPL